MPTLYQLQLSPIFSQILHKDQINPKRQTPKPELIKKQLQFHHLQLLRITKTENPLRFTPIHELNKLKKLHYQLNSSNSKEPHKDPSHYYSKNNKKYQKIRKKTEQKLKYRTNP